VTYAFIAAHSGEYPVTRMCKVLKVSISGYYAWLQRPASRRQQANETLLAAIRRVYKTSRCTYGSPRVHAELRREGIAAGRQRVARLMKTHGIAGK